MAPEGVRGQRAPVEIPQPEEEGRGKTPPYRTTARVANLHVHDDVLRAWAHASLRGHPTLVAVFMTDMMRSEEDTWPVYRADSGVLVMFDSYSCYAMAMDLGVEMLRSPSWARPNLPGYKEIMPKVAVPMMWLQVRSTPTGSPPKLVRDTAEGRSQIASAISSLKAWCQRTATPWLPPTTPSANTGV